MHKEDYTEKIEQYLDGELTGGELQQFEKELKEDAELAAEYRLQKDIRATLSDKGTMELREKLEKIRNNYKVPKRKHKNLLIIYASAASFIALILVSYCFIFVNTYSNEDLYRKYYKHINSGVFSRGTEVGPENDFNTALKEYENGEYKDAVSHFGKISDTSEYYKAAVFFTALSYMETQQFGEAVMFFKKIESDPESPYYEDIVWFLGLCYLKTDNSSSAEIQFKKLAESSSGYKNETIEILKHLSKNH